MRRAAAAGVAVLTAARRHVVLFALVLGLLLGPRVPLVAVLAAAPVAGLALRAAGTERQLAALVTAAILLAAWGGALRVRALERTALTPDMGHVVRGEATILQAPRSQVFGGWTALVRFRGEPVLLRARPDAPARRTAGLAGSPAGAPPVGAVVRLRAAVRPPDRYARILRAHAVLRSLGPPRAVGRRGGPPGTLDAIRLSGETALARGPDPVRAALLQGMVLGQDAGLPDAVRDEVRAAGLSHLTAASGANIVLLSTMVLAVAVAAGFGLRTRWLLVLGAIALYVPLAGGGPSIQRAGVMGAAGVIAVLAGRPAARWYALGLAAFLTLAADPRLAGDPGWQLSFAAVLALLLLARPWAARLERRRVPRVMAQVLAVTVAATLATAPVIAIRFGDVAPLSLPANVLVAPAVAPVMWLGAGAATAGPVAAPVSTLLATVADPLLRWVLFVARVAAHAPGAAPAVPPPVVAALCLCAVAALGVTGPLRVRVPGGRRLRAAVPAAGVAVVLVAAVVALRPPGPPAVPPVTSFRVSLLDVGQGDATLLQVPGHAILVDAGPPGAPIRALLERAGVRRLDALVVTHAQADHDGGATEVLERLPVGLLVDGRDGVRTARGDRIAGAARRRRVPVVAGRAGLALQAGPLGIRVLSPAEGPGVGVTGEDPNRRAIVAEATVAGARVLLPADAESDVLGALALGPVDVLKVAHHGSADPGLPVLLERLQPLIAGIEVGVGNSYGHPAPATLRALRTVPRTVRTDRDGTVRLDLGAAGWAITPARAGGDGDGGT